MPWWVAALVATVLILALVLVLGVLYRSASDAVSESDERQQVVTTGIVPWRATPLGR